MLKTQLLFLLIINAGALNATALEINTMDDYKTLCAQGKPFMLMFYAPWCGACQGMKQPYDEVSDVNAQEIILAKVNVDNSATKSLKEAFCISAIPTFITRHTGMMSKEALSSMVTKRAQPALKTPSKDVGSRQAKPKLNNKSIK